MVIIVVITIENGGGKKTDYDETAAAALCNLKLLVWVMLYTYAIYKEAS